MSRDDHVQLEGNVIEIAAGGNFRVEVPADTSVLAQLAGRMRQESHPRRPRRPRHGRRLALRSRPAA